MDKKQSNVVQGLLKRPEIYLDDFMIIEILLKSEMDIVELVLKHPSFDVNRGNGELLRYACSDDKYIHITKELLKFPNIDINAVNSKGKTAYELTGYYDRSESPLNRALLVADPRCHTVGLTIKTRPQSKKTNALGKEILSKVDYNFIFENPIVDGLPVRLLEIGDLEVPTGQLAVCDPLVCYKIKPLSKTVSP